MHDEEYRQLTDNLKYNLKDDPRVLGLIALGSMARQDYLPDIWSDHDFFVIVETGTQEKFRLDLRWLPDFENIAFHLLEKAYGVKVLYQNGHLLEFAVFDQEELKVVKVNRYLVLLDRGGIKLQLQTLKQNSAQQTSSPTEDSLMFGMFITNLLVGVGRYSRGERLNGHEFVKMYAASDLLKLLEKYSPSPTKGLLDNFNPWRRFERVYPELGRELDGILSLKVPFAAKALLELAARELATRLIDYPAQAVTVVAQQIEVAMTQLAILEGESES